VGGLLATSATAYAEPGLTVDPQSPAGVEYAVPLDQGRGHGGGSGGAGDSGGTGSAGGGDSSGLFGKGISAAAGNRAGKPSANGSRKPAGRARGKKRKSSPAGGGKAAVVAPVNASASYSTSGPVVGLIAAILLAGCGFGLFLRFRARRSPSDTPLP
jgi:hypothetical protein